MRIGRVASAAVCVLLVGLLAGCGGDGSETAEPTKTTAAPSATSASPAETSTTPPTSTWPTTDRSKEGIPTEHAAVLQAIRTAHHPTYDRLVLEFDRPVAGYVVGYVDEIREDASDRLVPLKGGAFLRVVVQGATTDNAFQLAAGDKHVKYTGPRSITPAHPQLQQVTISGDFEAVLSLGVGVTKKAGFNVELLDNPTRLVVDVATT